MDLDRYSYVPSVCVMCYTQADLHINDINVAQTNSQKELKSRGEISVL